MRDWQAVVEQQLAGLALEPAGKTEVIAELAAHLTEMCEEWRRQGMTEEEAARRTLSQVEDWQKLSRLIQTARTKENIMTNRVKQFWLPGLLTLLLSMGLLLFLQFSAFRPSAVSWGNNGLVLFYLPWLLSLPVFGALGAYLSSRAGGSRRAVLLSSVFPAVYPGICFFVILPLALLFSRTVAQHFQFQSLFPQVFAWLIIPIAALFIGGLGLVAASAGPLRTH